MKNTTLILAMLTAMAGVAFGQGTTDITISWEKNTLTIRSPRIPGERVDTNYLEAFCRKGGHDREWGQTVVPHTTKLVSAAPDQKSLELESRVVDKAPRSDGPVALTTQARMKHEIRAVADGVEFRLTITNLTDQALDIDWAQPCMRVDRFTGLNQNDYIRKCFIFTDKGLAMLDKLPRAEEARYRGGQVYVPKGIPPEDVNPRPISTVTPANQLIGCISADDKYLLAMAFEPGEELFQGVVVCVHNDFRIGGLAPKETKKIFGKVYFIENDTEKLLKHYRADFEPKK